MCVYALTKTSSSSVQITPFKFYKRATLLKCICLWLQKSMNAWVRWNQRSRRFDTLKSRLDKRLKKRLDKLECHFLLSYLFLFLNFVFHLSLILYLDAEKNFIKTPVAVYIKPIHALTEPIQNISSLNLSPQIILKHILSVTKLIITCS